MKKILAFMTVVLLAAVLMTGCGGSQQINSAGDASGQAAGEAQQASQENLPNTYVVESGDTIYDIAAKSEIYGNKYQWPLIYDANRDILDSYEKLSEGTRLIIPRDVDAAKIEDAIKRAEELNYPAKDSSASASSDTIESGSVAGMENEDETVERKSMAAAARVEKGEESASAVSEEQPAEEMPAADTSAPAAKTKKKGGVNGGILIVLLLLVAGGAGLYVFFQKKKKEEEEEEASTEKKDDNILS